MIGSKNSSKFYDYREGNIPVIFLSVHDGSQKTPDCKTRVNHFNAKEFVTQNDTNTKTVTLEVYKFFKKHNLFPYLLINDVKRKHVDLNRKISKGCNISCDPCINYHFLFHEKLDAIVSEIMKKYKKCFIVDIHGNMNTHNMVQMGYGVSKTNILRNNIKTMSFKSIKDKADIDEYFYGEKSLSKFFQDKSFETFPTYQKINKPFLKTIKYYSGSKLIMNKFKDICDVVLLEISKNLRAKKNLKFLSTQIGQSLLEYYLNVYVKL
jgi:hypothetical protein